MCFMQKSVGVQGIELMMFWCWGASGASNEVLVTLEDLDRLYLPGGQSRLLKPEICPPVVVSVRVQNVIKINFAQVLFLTDGWCWIHVALA